MSNVVVNGNHYLGRGEVYFDRFDNSGLSTGERFLGNVEDLKANTNVESVKKYSSASAAGEQIGEAVIRTTAELTAVCDEFMKENLALFFRGTEGTYSQGSGSFTSGSPDTIVAKLDRYVSLAKRSVSAVVVKNSGQTVTYVLGTDYTVDAVMGRLYFPSNSTIAADATLKVEYSYAAASQARVSIGQSPQIKGKLRFVGKNTQGPVMNAEFWIVQIGGDGDLGLIQQDNFGNFTLKASVLADTVNHASSPLGVIEYIG